MTARLLEFTRDALPTPLRWRRLPASVMRFFLPPDVATSLGVPRTPVLDWLVKVWFFFEAKVTRFKFYDAFNRMVFKEWGGRDARARSLLQFSRFFNRRLVDRVQRFDCNEPLKDGHRPSRRRASRVEGAMGAGSGRFHHPRSQAAPQGGAPRT